MHYNSLLKPALSTLVYSLLAAGSISAAYAAPPKVVMSYYIGDRYLFPFKADATGIIFGENITIQSNRTYDSLGNQIDSALWTLVSKPIGSKVAIDHYQKNAYDLKLFPDKKGIYKIHLKITNRNNETTEKTFTLTLRNSVPNLGAIASKYTTFKHSPTIISPRGVIDVDGDTLKYSWTINTKPPGSTVTLGTFNGSFLRFKPDRYGDYQITVTANDSETSVSKNLTVKALQRTANGNKLEVPPGPVIYSNYINRLVLKPDYLPMIYLVNPDTLAVEQIDLPSVNGQQATRNSLVLSKNGRYAALSYNTGLSKTKDEYDQKVRIMDLSTGSLIRTVTLKSRVDYDYLALSNQGMLYALEFVAGSVPEYPPEEDFTKNTIRVESINAFNNAPSTLSSAVVVFGELEFGFEKYQLNVADNRRQLFFSGSHTKFVDDYFLEKHLFNYNFDLTTMGEVVFPASNIQLKARSVNYYHEEDPNHYCYTMLSVSKDNGKLYTGFNFYYRPFSFETERNIPNVAVSNYEQCVTHIAESPTSDQHIVLQKNNYTILSGNRIIERGNLKDKYGFEWGSTPTAFYSNNNTLILRSSTPQPFLFKYN
jgi:hypothetical protein